MRLISEGARQVLMDRIQCMRDTNDAIDYQIEDLMHRRAVCCGYYHSSSSSSSTSSSSSSSSTPETFFILEEDDDIEINEDGVFPINEEA